MKLIEERKKTIALKDSEEKIAEVLEDFWSTYQESCEYTEDQLPLDWIKETTRTIMQAAKATMETLSIREITGGSRFHHSVRSRVINTCLENAKDAINSYFDELAHA